ncbi:hypothetical protein DTL70_13835 [Streptomyces diacarni]|uniref:Uncharacterized protein n=1 Tax=Streptomyces diacarni TaxID=2800381 RepID=A0A367F222_9ACTN|nr:hypothetical protein DTL70_13835 [Streptomyces diacarni]
MVVAGEGGARRAEDGGGRQDGGGGRGADAHECSLRSGRAVSRGVCAVRETSSTPRSKTIIINPHVPVAYAARALPDEAGRRMRRGPREPRGACGASPPVWKSSSGPARSRPVSPSACSRRGPCTTRRRRP